MSFKPLSQRNPTWKDINLGTSRTTTIGSHGCTITCIAMLAGLTPDDVNKRLKAVKGFAKTNLVVWSKIEEAIPWLRFTWRGYSYKNDEVLKAIEKNGACLVEVDFDNNVRTDGVHWVLFTGNQNQLDPWTGNVTPTSKYSMKTGYAIIEVIGNKESENMPDNLDWKGLDPTNLESLNVAVQVWDKVVNQDLYISKNQHNKLMDEARATAEKQIAAQKGLVTKESKKAYDLGIELSDAKLRIAELEKAKPAEAIKDPMRYVVSMLVGAVITWAYTQYPVLGELGPDQQAIATFLIGLIVKGLDKYQHEAGSKLKLPF